MKKLISTILMILGVGCSGPDSQESPYFNPTQGQYTAAASSGSGGQGGIENYTNSSSSSGTGGSGSFIDAGEIPCFGDHMVVCDNECTNLFLDMNNCGSCGNSCFKQNPNVDASILMCKEGLCI